MDKLNNGEEKVEHELENASCLIGSIQKLGFYNGKNVSSLNISRIEVKEKFSFETVKLKELYDAIDATDNIRSPGSSFLNARAIKAAKFAIEPICYLFLTHALFKCFPIKFNICFH